jgi:hypothetical protein
LPEQLIERTERSVRVAFDAFASHRAEAELALGQLHE